jgi:hypothetical protein
MEPKRIDHWNVAYMNGALLLSADDFSVKLSALQVDKFLDLLNTTGHGEVRDMRGDKLAVQLNGKYVTMIRVNDKTYPAGVQLPITAFSMSAAEANKEIPEALTYKFLHKNKQITHSVLASSPGQEKFVQAMRELDGKPVKIKKIKNQKAK